MNANALRFLLAQSREPGPVASPRAHTHRPRLWLNTSAGDLVRERLEGGLHLLLLAALVFALGGFLRAM